MAVGASRGFCLLAVAALCTTLPSGWRSFKARLIGQNEFERPVFATIQGGD